MVQVIRDSAVNRLTISGGGSGVSSLNSLTGDLSLVAGTNITITPSGSNITIDATGSGGSPGGTSGQVQYNNAGVFGGFTVGGDATLDTSTGALTVSKTGGASFAASATTDTTTTANITDSTNKRFVTDADLLVLSATSGTNTGDITIGTANGLSLSGQAISMGLGSSTAFGAVKVDGTTITASAGVISAVGGGSGDVSGPSSATDSDFVQFDGTTGKLIKDGGYSASSFEVPLTFSTGLTRSVNTITIDSTVATLSGSQALTNKDLTGVGNTFPTLNQNTTGSAAKWTTARNLAGNSVDGSANVAFANKFIVQGTTDSGLSGAQFLGSLGTGIVKNTTTTGVLSIATAGTDYCAATSGSSVLKGSSGSTTAATAGTDYVAPGTVTAFTAQQYFATSALTDAASISWNLSTAQSASLTIGGNRTLSNPTNMQNGGTYTLVITQGASGSHTLAYGTAYKWAGGTAPTLSTAAGAIDILTFISDGTSMYGVAQLNFS